MGIDHLLWAIRALFQKKDTSEVLKLDAAISLGRKQIVMPKHLGFIPLPTAIRTLMMRVCCEPDGTKLLEKVENKWPNPKERVASHIRLGVGVASHVTPRNNPYNSA